MRNKESILIMISGAIDFIDLENHNNWKLYKRLSSSFEKIFIISRSNEIRNYGNIHNLGIKRRNQQAKFLGFFIKLLDIWKCLTKINKISQSFKDKNIHYLASEATFGGVVCLFNKLFFKRNYIVEHQGIVLSLPSESYGKLNSYLIKQTSKITTIFSYKVRAVSKPIFETLVRNDIRRKKISLIYPRYNSDIFKYYKKKDNYKNDKKNLLFVGRLVISKGLIYLIKALKNNTFYHLNIVGDGYLGNELKDYCLLNKILNVTFHGSLSSEEIYEFMKKSDLLLVPSVDEGLGRVVLEAKATGLPVYSSYVGGLKDLFHQGLIDNTFEPASEKSIASLLKKPLPKRYKLSKDKLKDYEFETNIRKYIKFIKS